MYGDEEGGGFPRDLAGGDIGGWADASFDIYDMNLAKSYIFFKSTLACFGIPLSPFHPPSPFFVSKTPLSPSFSDSKHRHRNVHLQQPRKAARPAPPPNHQPHHPHQPPRRHRHHRPFSRPENRCCRGSLQPRDGESKPLLLCHSYVRDDSGSASLFERYTVVFSGAGVSVCYWT